MHPSPNRQFNPHNHQSQPHYNHQSQSNDGNRAQDRHGQVESQIAPVPTTRPYLIPPIKSSSSRQTGALAWICGIVCAIVWALIIIAGLAVLIVYLLFRPKSPRFEISSVTLNGAYLDMGTLLNADLTILANFTNPNRKVDVTFHYVVVDVYFKGALIATQGVDQFSERARESTLRSMHMVTSEVALSRDQAGEWRKEVGGSDGVKMEVKGRFLTTSDFVGTFLRYTYVLHGRCKIAVGGPPGGVLLSSNCTTKR